ncbi:MAG TPA: hypothetical protein VKZ86_14005 [Cyclobacteriaceae bacterium]|nr:hypothetical protein [Cyclobacteriaceae bacterium]
MNQTHHEEIDLVELLARSLRALRRHLVLILICLGVTIGFAVWIWSASARVYESRMLIYSSILTESYCQELAESLNALVRDGNHGLLADRLGLTEEQASAIRKVTMEGALETASEQERLAIVVTVRILDNSMLPDLQEGIIEFISQNDFVRVRTEEKKRAYQELIARVEQEIEKLESVKQSMLQGSRASASATMLMNPSEAYVSTVELVKEKLELEEKLRLVNSVQVVEGFVPIKKPVSPKLSILLPVGFVAGLLLAVVIIALRYAWALSERNE